MRYQEPAKLECSAKVIAGLHDILDSGDYTNNKFVKQFESRFKEEFELRGHCIAVNGCQSGLMLILKALGIFYALVPDFTFSATANAVYWACHSMRTGDCDLKTFNLEPRIPSDVDAVLATHIFGNPADCDALQEVADKDNLPLIYDAAHAIGATYKGKPIGDMGTASVFSFSPTKQIVAGEGGMIVTKDAYLAERLRILRNYGTEDGYDQSIPGLNSRLSEFHAILAMESLYDFRRRQKHRLSLVEEYHSYFGEKMAQKTNPDGQHAWKDYSLLLGNKRERIETILNAKSIPFKRYFKPISHLSCYKGWLAPQGNASTLYEGILQLPLHDNLSTDDVRMVAKMVSRGLM